jgi:hypothetical protein
MKWLLVLMPLGALRFLGKKIIITEKGIYQRSLARMKSCFIHWDSIIEISLQRNRLWGEELIIKASESEIIHVDTEIRGMQILYKAIRIRRPDLARIIKSVPSD